MTPQPQQDNFYKLTRWDLEEFYDAIAHINGKAEADRMWERIERNTRSRTTPSAQIPRCLCTECSFPARSSRSCRHALSGQDKRKIEATIRNQTRKELFDIINSGKSALYEIQPDGQWNQILQAKMDVLCWIEESLRSIAPTAQERDTP